MPKLSRSISLFCLVATLPGCGNRAFSPRSTNPVIEDRVRAGHSDQQKMSVLSTRADRRTILIMKPNKVCAEPPPDVAEALNAQAKLNLEAKGVSLGAGSSLQTAIQQLTRRSQGLELYRTAAFVNCMMYMNDQFGGDETPEAKAAAALAYRTAMDKAFDKAVELITAEMDKLPTIAGALQVVGATELQLKTQADEAAAAKDKAATARTKAEAEAARTGAP